ncbi:MAG: hypothetical protein ACO1OB_32910 [Archangium sp.]
MRAPRGQNLVLLALTMLFLTLMVTMTIGLGLRVRQKQELQNIADAAAFSNAVMTARAYNNAALINRLEVSYWVAQAADQSLISWTTYSRAVAGATDKATRELAQQGCVDRLRNSAQVKRDLTDYRNAVNNYVSGGFNNGFEGADEAAGEEARAIQGAIAGLRAELSDGISHVDGDLQDRLYKAVGSQRLTRHILQKAGQDDISIIDTGAGQAPKTAADLSRQEMDCDYGATGNPALEGGEPGGTGLCLRSTWSDVVLSAAMGTRGSAFLTGRSAVPPRLANELGRLDGNYPNIRVESEKTGSAYWASSQNHGALPSGREAWGDDHGTVTIVAGNCRVSVEAMSFVRSTHLLDTTDQHKWTQGNEAGGDADDDHTMGDCTPLCPSVWVRTLGFQPNDSAADAWGQPKVMVALQRDLNNPDRRFPWELHFKFPFSATGEAAEWDGRGKKLHTRGSNNLNISRQTAIATGLAYYHRRDHWDEFPNLLNPFWRATLAPIDVDSEPRDLNRALSAPQYQWQRTAWNSLRSSGFEALR